MPAEAVMSLKTVEAASPELIVLATATAIYIGGAFLQHRRLWSAVGMAGLVIAAWRLAAPAPALPSASPIAIDLAGNYIRWMALAVGAILLLLVARRSGSRQPGEEIGSLLLAVGGLMLTTIARDLALLFLGLELISIPTYVLLYLGRRDSASQEAAAKYFFLSILASAFLLYGFSFLYGIAGSTHFESIGAALAQTEGRETGLVSLGPLALVLVLAGLGFKLTAVPFHFYAPDVYQGTTSANAAVLAILPKAAAMVAIVRLLIVAMPAWSDFGWRVMLVLAVVTMTLGNTLALWQTHVRRMLAYSSIAHAGYLMIGLAVALAAQSDAREVASYDGLAAALFYLLVYSLATAGAFASLVCLEGDRGSETLDDLNGLGRRHPVSGFCLAIAMFSLAGVPPLAGFWGKLTLFLSGLGVDSGVADSRIHPWFLALAIIGVLNAAVAAAYYLRIVGASFFAAPTRLDDERSQASLAGQTAAILATVAILALGFLPGQFIARANLAAKELRGQERQAATSVAAAEVTPAPESGGSAADSPSS